MSPLVEASLGSSIPPLLGADEMSGPLEISGLMIRDALPMATFVPANAQVPDPDSASPVQSKSSTPTSSGTPKSSPTTPRRPVILTDAATLATAPQSVEVSKSDKDVDKGKRGWLTRRGDEKLAKEKSEHKWPGLARRLTERMHRKFRKYLVLSVADMTGK